MKGIVFMMMIILCLTYGIMCAERLTANRMLGSSKTTSKKSTSSGPTPDRRSLDRSTISQTSKSNFGGASPSSSSSNDP